LSHQVHLPSPVLDVSGPVVQQISVSVMHAAMAADDTELGLMPVSRMTSPQPRPTGALRKPIPRRKARDIMYGPTPIEWTLRQRQALQPSASEPSLVLQAGSATTLPRLGSPSHSSSAGRTVTEDQHWIGLLGGQFQVGIPFNKFGEDAYSSAWDSDVYVKWFRSVEDEAVHAASRFRDGPARGTFMPWADEKSRMLTELSNAEPSSGHALRLQFQADLYEYLDTKAVARGFEAFLTAITFRLDDAETMSGVLDCNGRGELSLMEFAGALGLLALNSSVLCNMDDISVFAGLDPDNDGLFRLHELAAAMKIRGMTARRDEEKRRKREPKVDPGGKEVKAINVGSFRQGAQRVKAEDMNVRSAKVKWANIARWMASASQRSLCLRRERLNRGWKLKPKPVDEEAGGEAAGQGSPFVTETAPERVRGNATADAGLEAQGATQRKGTKFKRRAMMSCKEGTLESLAAMRQQEHSLKRHFMSAATIKLPDGTIMMSRADLHQFFSDLSLADERRSACLSAAALDKHYDEALELQCNATRIGNGLAFWSFKVVLNNVIPSMGLNWVRLVDWSLIPANG